MRRYIPKSVRQLVAERAGHRCEYCRVLESDSNFDFHIEHIISIQHGGTDAPDNLAYACSICNWKKGSNISTLLDGELVPLFNPRREDWFRHFGVENGLIFPHSKIATATIKLLDFNNIDNVIERQELAEVGRYP